MLELLWLLLIEPIRQALLYVLEAAHGLSGSYGLALVILSLAFNLLLMPAYHLAEIVQQRERAIQRRMARKVEEFKFAFKGQERYWMLRTLYRQNHYHPVYALRALLPLAIQIPFFIATFGLLSAYPPLKGVPFLGLADLGQPDGLLHGINLLPLVMTALNMLAVHLHSRDGTRAERVQGHVIALVFLVFLYASPAGLVMYWTINNLVSVLKSGFYAMRRGAAREPAGAPGPSWAPQPAPSIGWLARLHAAISASPGRLYGLTALALFVFLGMALPITLTGLEDNVDGLVGYITFFALCSAAFALVYGLLAWGAYRLAPPRLRSLAVYLGLTLLLALLAYGFGYQPDAGVLDNFVFANPQALAPAAAGVLADVLVLLACCAAAAWLLERHPEWTANGLIVLTLGSLGMGGWSLYSLQERITRKSEEEIAGGSKLFNYTRGGKNVLLLFVDGAMSGYIPDILREDPQLARKLAGFTWYSNVVSTGNRTINGLPALFGGFDYTVSQINQRAGDSLKDKVSAAYRIYVENFAARGYQVLYSDPFWFGFARKGDCELFNAQYQASGQGSCIHSIGKQVAARKARVREGSGLDLFRGLAQQYFSVALFKVAPRSLKQAVYGGGQWLGMSYSWKNKEDKYLNNFFSLDSLGELSGTGATRDTFTFITNELTRAPLFLKDDCLPDRSLTSSDQRLKLLMNRYRSGDTTAIYQTTKCTLQALGRYMDWFRQSGLYDRTMIAVASDHGWVSRNPVLSQLPNQVRYSMFQSFLLFKDFNEPGKPLPDLRESREFITNANVPGMLCQSIGGCLDKTTGKTITRQRLQGSVLLHETPWQPSGQQPGRYVVEALYSVRDDITQPQNWQVIQPRIEP